MLELCYNRDMLWIVGHAFKDIRDYLESRGIQYGVITNKQLPPHKALADVSTVALDFRSASSLIASAKAADIKVSAVLVAGYENYVLPSAILAYYFDVPGLTTEAATAVTDKAVMRQKFIDYNSAITPAFHTVSAWSDIEVFMATHTFPVILKPTNLMKSLYVTKSDSIDELRANYTYTSAMLSAIGSKIYTLEHPQMLIEECMSGTMHTAAGYADAFGEIHLLGSIVDCVTGQDIGKRENYIYSRQMPTALDDKQIYQILDVASQGARALNLTSTMLHIEIMLTADGPKLIEIGARIGGYRTRMYEYGSGIDMNKALINVAHGNTADIISHRNRSIAVLELFPDIEGRFAGIVHEAELKKLASLRHYSLKSFIGDQIGRSSHGFKAAAVIILGNDNHQQFETNLAFVRDHVSIQLA